MVRFAEIVNDQNSQTVDVWQDSEHTSACTRLFRSFLKFLGTAFKNVLENVRL